MNGTNQSEYQCFSEWLKLTHLQNMHAVKETEFIKEMRLLQSNVQINCVARAPFCVEKGDCMVLGEGAVGDGIC